MFLDIPFVTKKAAIAVPNRVYTEYRHQGFNYFISQSRDLVTIKCSNRNIFVNIDALKRSDYFRFGQGLSSELKPLKFFQSLTHCSSFHINARQKFNNQLTFDFTAFPSKTVEILLDALHFHVVCIPKKCRNFMSLFELLIFLLDDGKQR